MARHEKAMLHELVERERAAVGVRLGSQLLAEAAGGSARRASAAEIGRHQGRGDGRGLTRSVLSRSLRRFKAFQWHSYEFIPPPAPPHWREARFACKHPDSTMQSASSSTPRSRPRRRRRRINDYRSDEDAVRIGWNSDALAAGDRVYRDLNEVGRALSCGRFLDAVHRSARLWAGHVPSEDHPRGGLLSASRPYWRWWSWWWSRAAVTTMEPRRTPRPTFRRSASKSPRTRAPSRSPSPRTSRATRRSRCRTGGAVRRSGSNKVCDRDKLIRFLKANPTACASGRGAGRQADVLGGVEVHRQAPPGHADPRHAGDQPLVHERARGAVPGDPPGRDRGAGRQVRPTRWRAVAGNPLGAGGVHDDRDLQGLPAQLQAAQAMRYGHKGDYDETYYRRDYYSNGDYDEVFISRTRSGRYKECYEAYPDPPTVRIVDRSDQRRRRSPNRHAHPHGPANPRRSAPQTGGLQCDPPRSQLESEQCAEQRGERRPRPRRSPPSQHPRRAHDPGHLQRRPRTTRACPGS